MRGAKPALLAVLLMAIATFSDAQEIDRIEPPFWWTGFEHREVQLMLHGNNISLLTPAVEHDGVSISRVVRVESPNYLFVYLDIEPGAEPGTLGIVFSEGGYSFERTYELRGKSTDPAHTRGFSSADSIYLVIPDRFANGDPDNDEFYFLDDKLDREDPYGRHGGDLAGIENHLDYIAGMGFTSLWLTPVFESNEPVASYHGYSTTDHYTVDPRLGTNEQFRELTAKMKARGIGMIMDQVLNHAGTGHWWMDDLPTGDWLNFQDKPVLTPHRRTTNMDPYASEYDKRLHTGGWILESLPDLDQRNPLLADYLVQNSIWWIEYVGLQGIRIDSWPYADKQFLGEWARRIMREYPSFNIVGQEWSELPAVTSYWQRGRRNPDGYISYLASVFDFPVQAAFVRALTSNPDSYSGVWVSLYELVGLDFLYPDPMNVVIFPGNHDMDRVYTRLDENFDLYRMAMVYYATMRGIPQFLYGDEILVSHPDTSNLGEMRSDFPGGWDGDVVNAFSGDGLTGQQLEAQQLVSKLLNWRKNNATVQHGEFMHFAPVKNVYAYFRFDENDTIMVVLNRDDQAVTLDTARFAERIGNATHGTDVVTGERFNIEESLVLEPRSALLLELGE
jgi:glycosidase